MAFSSRKGKPKGSSKTGGTPLDARQRELREEQERIDRQIAELQSKISQVPISDREAQRRDRAAAAANKPPAPRRVPVPMHRHSAVLVDPRYDEHEAPLQRNKPSRRRRREIRQAQLQTLALIVLLLAAIAWALHWWLVV